MPESIADLVQKGTDHPPLNEHHSGAMILPNACFGYKYDINCGPPTPSGQAEPVQPCKASSSARPTCMWAAP
jgi:hypothetical protein